MIFDTMEHAAYDVFVHNTSASHIIRTKIELKLMKCKSDPKVGAFELADLFLTEFTS